MWKRKEIKSVSAASVVDLKGELLKASETFQKQKTKGTTPIVVTSGPKIIKPAKRKIESIPDYLSDEEKRPEPNVETSYVSLARKAAEYERLKQAPVSAQDDSLVDFLVKATTETETEELVEEGWTEITDEFGRVRLIINPKHNVTEAPIENNEELDVKKNLHYDNRKEIRTMGVGFYQFSAQEEERKRQMEALKSIRHDTQDKQLKSSLLKEAKRSAREKRKQEILQKGKEKASKLTSDSVDEFLGQFK